MLQCLQPLPFIFVKNIVMKRTVIKIDEDKCNGCALCVKGCHEGALQIIDGKARMVNDLFCDGLGACIGECPLGAIEFEEREAEPYSEYAVMERISPKGEKTIKAHLLHLKEHNEMEYLKQGLNYLKENNIQIDLLGLEPEKPVIKFAGCPGSREIVFNRTDIQNNVEAESQLQQWPVQLHLLNPQASYFKNADLLLAADCTAFSYGNFHNRFMKNHVLAIACPKLDTKKENYVEKLTSMINDSNINTITVVIMEVPCCGGLVQLVQQAVTNANRKVPVKRIVIGIKGDIISEDWI